MTLLSCVNQAGKSVIRYATTVSHHLSLKHNRTRSLYDIPPYGQYAIFRETVSNLDYDEPSVVLVFGFRLKLIGSHMVFHWLFQRICILTTPFWSGFRGFRVKLWMVDPTTKNYLGIYEWRGENNAKAYVEFLTPILNLFSSKNTTWHQVYPDQDFETFLTEHKLTR